MEKKQLITMKQIDKTADVLSSLKLAMQLEDKREIVIHVVECILNAFSSSPCTTTDKDLSEMVDRTEFIQKMNSFINELKADKSETHTIE